MELVSWPGIPGEILIPKINQTCVFMHPGEVDVHITPNRGYVQFTNNEAPYYVKQPVVLTGKSTILQLGTLNINPRGYALKLEAIFHVPPHDNSKLVTLVRKGMPGGYSALAVSDKAREVAKRVDALIQDSENKGLTPTEQSFLLHLDTRPDRESFDKMLAESASILDSFIEERLSGQQQPEFLSWPDAMEIIRKVDGFFMKEAKVTFRRKVRKRYQIQDLQNKLQKELINNASELVAYAGAGIVIFSMWLRHQLR